MAKAIVIPRHPGSSIRMRHLDGLAEIESVTGGWAKPFEMARLDSTLWSNQAAVLERGGFNARATAFSWYYASSPGRTFEPVLGDAVLTGPLDDPVVGMEMPARVLETLLEPHHFVIQASPRDEEHWRDTHICFDNIFEASTWCMIIGLIGLRGWDVRINPDDPHGDQCDHSPFRAVV